MKKILIFIAGMLFLPISIVLITIVVKAISINNSKASPISISEEFADSKEKLDWYSSLGLIQSETSDEIPLLIEVSFGYKQGNKSASKEITSRTLELRDYLRKYFHNKTKYEIHSSNENDFRIEILNDINENILTSSKIKDIRFIQLNVIEKKSTEKEEMTSSKDTFQSSSAKEKNNTSATSLISTDVDNIFDVAKSSSKNQIIGYFEKKGLESYNSTADNGNLYYQPKLGNNITFHGMELNAIVIGYYYDDLSFNLLNVSIKKGSNWLITKSLIEEAENTIINKYGFVYSERSNTYKSGKYGFSVSENQNEISFVFSNW